MLYDRNGSQMGHTHRDGERAGGAVCSSFCTKWGGCVPAVGFLCARCVLLSQLLYRHKPCYKPVTPSCTMVHHALDSGVSR